MANFDFIFRCDENSALSIPKRRTKFFDLKWSTSICSAILCTIPVQAKKNVLFIMADDFNYWAKCIGYYPEAQTPVIDGLAAQGILFKNAMNSSPVCNPSRNALWSGFRPSTTMIQGNADGYVRDKAGFANIVSMHQYFKQNGYHVLGAGKLWHPGSMGSKETDPANWSELITDGSGCNGGSYKKYNGSQYGWSGNESPMTTANCADYNLATKIASRISGYHTGANKDKPFFIGIGLFRPHTPFNSPKVFWDKFDNNKMVPGPGVESKWYVTGSGDKNHSEITKAGVWKDGIHGYLASMALTDYNVGLMLDALDKSPLRDSTIVLFMGDHGWDLGEHGRWGKFSRWNSSNNTTLIIYDPSAKGNGKVCEKPVSLQDLYRTLVDLCGLPAKNDVEGYSISHLLDCPDDEYWKHPALMSYGGVNYIRTEKWYFINDGNSSELYDNVADPYQWKNLYGQSAYTSVVAGLRHQIDSIVSIGSRMKADLINYGSVKPENYFIQQPEPKTSCECSDSISPTTPGTIVSGTISSTSLSLTWGASTDNEAVTQYEIYANNNLSATSGTNSVTLTGLICNTDYSVKIKAKDACNNASDFNEPIVLKTKECDDIAPTVPGAIQWGAITDNSVSLSWDPSTDNSQMEAYEVFVDGNLHSTTTQPSATITLLTCNKSYEFKVRAKDVAGNYSGFNTPASVKTADCPACVVNVQGGNGAQEGQTPYVVNNIPGRILAVNFDNGGQNVAYYETDGRATWAHPTFRTDELMDIDEADGSTVESGEVIGGVWTGEWAEYTVNIASAGEYSLKVGYGCNGDKVAYFKLDNEIVGCLNTLPSTGKASTYGVYTLPSLLNLPAGQHVFAWVSESSTAFNLDWFEFTMVNPSTNYNAVQQPQIKYLITPVADNNKRIYLDLSYSDPSVEIEIVDLQGKAIVKEMLSGEHQYVEFALPQSIASGVYLLKVNNHLRSSVEKFIVN